MFNLANRIATLSSRGLPSSLLDTDSLNKPWAGDKTLVTKNQSDITNNTTFFNEVRRVLPFIDTDTTRFSEWLFILRASYGLSTEQFYFDVPDICATNTNEHASVAIDIIKRNAKIYLGIDLEATPEALTIYRGNKFARVFLVRDGVPIMLCLFGRGDSSHSLLLVGDPELVNFTGSIYERIYATEASVTVKKLIALSENGPEMIEKTLQEDQIEKAFDAFYPFIKGGLDELIAAYDVTHDPVLFLYGPPGTGKSTLIRHLMFKLRRKQSFAVASEQVLGHPRFMAWMESRPEDSFIYVEDAGEFVARRDESGGGNASMSALLNYLRGVTVTNNRVVISSNIIDTRLVDTALARTGRTFRSIEFRKLTLEEANAARAALGKAEIDLKDSDNLNEVERSGGSFHFTLSEALNFEHLAEQCDTTKRTGFLA